MNDANLELVSDFPQMPAFLEPLVLLISEQVSVCWFSLLSCLFVLTCVFILCIFDLHEKCEYVMISVRPARLLSDVVALM